MTNTQNPIRISTPIADAEALWTITGYGYGTAAAGRILAGLKVLGVEPTGEGVRRWHRALAA